ncbi:MFS transporter [Planctomicrobium piriforme]|uniref:Major Facilitator Superfamily protein n=1 Tax=Planctomicrobium piriforme TaxID=1576369 RepID=A0A1I3EZS9_9PLAN|nr:MFS transporter [Planctomicrobium piriforme]SFI04437.1 Major Facilitator Superfamily protein [Planctomicrobium piriforme]
MTTPVDTRSPGRWTMIQTLVCITAAIGFAFDTYELLMLPLIAPAAIQELTGFAPGSPESLAWIKTLFFVPAFFGAFFGLLGGWLTDRLGRRRVLTGSILLYAIAAFVSGYSTSMNMLLICRCLVFVGVCVEFVAAVAWLAELFDDPVQRERVIGYTQAFASFGGLLVAFVNHELASHASSLPAIYLPEWASGIIGTLKNPDPVWRLTLMSGLFPAIPLIVVRPFLPESPKWAAKKQAGELKRPSLRELFTPALRRTTIVSTLLVGCGYGLAFGAIQQIPQIVRGLPDVEAKAATMTKREAGAFKQKVAASYSEFQEVGGLVGRFLLAFLAMRIASRRGLLSIFVVPALIVLPMFFLAMARGTNTLLFNIGNIEVTALSLGTFFAGMLVIAQFSFWGNYLPRVFPLHLRGTGESMAANIGGRLIGTSFAWITATLAAASWMPGKPGPSKIATVAAGVAAALCLTACLLTVFLPEPPPEEPNDPTTGAVA